MEVYECEHCLEKFQTNEALLIHIANQHVMDVDDSMSKEINEGRKNSETGRYNLVLTHDRYSVPCKNLNLFQVPGMNYQKFPLR